MVQLAASSASIDPDRDGGGDFDGAAAAGTACDEAATGRGLSLGFTAPAELAALAAEEGTGGGPFAHRPPAGPADFAVVPPTYPCEATAGEVDELLGVAPPAPPVHDPGTGAGGLRGSFAIGAFGAGAFATPEAAGEPGFAVGPGGRESGFGAIVAGALAPEPPPTQ